MAQKKNIIIAAMAVICLIITVANYVNHRDQTKETNELPLAAYKAGWYAGAVSQGAHLTEVKDAFAWDSLQFAKFIEQ